jgi:transcriptional regulator with XRE-family HTH domain
VHRIKLKLAIVASGKSQRRIATDSQITENRISEIVCGWVEPTAVEQARIAAALNTTTDELFNGSERHG